MLIDYSKLKALYDGELKAVFAKLDPMNRQLFIWFVLTLIIILASIVLLFVVVPTRSVIILSFSFAFFGQLLLIRLFWVHHKNVTEPFRTSVLGRLIHLLDDELVYKSDRFVSKERVIASGLFPNDFIRISGGNLVKGHYDQVRYEFSGVWLECVRFAHKQDIAKMRKAGEHIPCTYDESDEYVDVFTGVFYHAVFNKMILGKTYILPRRSALRNKLWPDFYFPQDVPEVFVENYEFSQVFQVFSDDSVEAKYILTPRYMELLLSLSHTLKRKMAITCVGNQLSIAIPSCYILEINPRFTKTNLDKVNEIYKFLSTLRDIVMTLNLNQRIWGKIIEPEPKRKKKSDIELFLGPSVTKREDK